MFAVDGRCLDQPCEPDGGKLQGQRAPALVSARGALRPRLRVPRSAGSQAAAAAHRRARGARRRARSLEADDSSLGGGGPPIIPCNWLQHFENVVDRFHVPILHGVFSGHQFVPAMAQMPQVEWSATERGVRVEQLARRSTTAGACAASPRRRCRRCASCRARASAGSAPVESIGWVLPIDDTHFRIYVAGRVEQPGDIGRMRSKMNGKFWWELSEAEHREFPGDYEAQVEPGRDHRAFGRAPAHQRPRRRAAAPLPARAAAPRRAPATTRRRRSRRRPTRRCASPTAATSSPHEGPARDAADAGGAVHRGHPRPRARSRAARIPLVAERRRARRRRCRPRLADAARPAGPPAARRLGLLGRGRGREAARARPRAAGSRRAHRRPRAGGGDRPVRRRRWRCAMRARSSSTRRSNAQRDWTRRPLPIARHRVGVLGTGAMGGEIAAWLERVRPRRSRLEPALARIASSDARGERDRRLRVAADRRDRRHPRRARVRARCRAAPTSSTSRAGAHRRGGPDRGRPLGASQRRGARRAAARAAAGRRSALVGAGHHDHAAHRRAAVDRDGRRPVRRQRRALQRGEPCSTKSTAPAATRTQPRRPRAEPARRSHAPRPAQRHHPVDRMHRQAHRRGRRAGSRGRRRDRAVAAPERPVHRRQVGDAHAVDGDDDVLGLQPRRFGRAVGGEADDMHLAADLDAVEAEPGAAAAARAAARLRISARMGFSRSTGTNMLPRIAGPRRRRRCRPPASRRRPARRRR